MAVFEDVCNESGLQQLVWGRFLIMSAAKAGFQQLLLEAFSEDVCNENEF